MREGRGWRGGIKDESGRDGSAAMVVVRRDDGGDAAGKSTAAAGEEDPRVAHQRVYWVGRRSLVERRPGCKGSGGGEGDEWGPGRWKSKMGKGGEGYVP